MRKYILTILTLCFASAYVYAADDAPARYKLNVQDFCELSVVDDVPVEYCCNCDSAGWVVFACEPSMASHIMFSNTNEHLTIRTDCDEAPIAGMPVVKVYSAVLRKATNSGDSLLTLNLDIAVPLKDFKVRQIGNGRINVHGLNCENLEAGVTAGNGTVTLAGKARKAKINNVGSGPVQARDLDVVNINCYVFGSGNIECRPSENLRVYGAGSGKIIYHGEPKVTSRSLGVKAIPHTPDMAITVTPHH